MSLSAHETALLNFGREVLEILQADENWSDEISLLAEGLDLAEFDDSGLFRVASVGYFESVNKYSEGQS
jgi:hypothetical protein